MPITSDRLWTERRTLAVPDLKIEARAEGDAPTARRIAGHAAVFDQLSEDLGGFREKIAPGAFAASLATDDVRALFNHDFNFVLGRNVAGTLRLAEDEVGLAVGIDPPDTQAVRDLVITPMERGDITQMSFGFRTISDEWAMQDGLPVRTLKAVRLFDVSVVAIPAFPQTDAAVRSLGHWRAEQMPARVVPVNLLKARALNAAV